jgi:hypothetical protein
MNVREAIEGSEYILSETGEEIVCCPVCQTVWMQDLEGDVEHGECSHLRFVYYSEVGEIEPIGNWKSNEFVEQFSSVTFKDIDEPLDPWSAFEKLTSSDVDQIICKSWNDMPLVQWSIFWGYAYP